MNLRFFLVGIVVLFGTIAAHAQAISLSYTSAPTVCFNTGFIVVNATGGIAPYKYAIISGPNYVNFLYPDTIVGNRDTFFDIPQGTFRVQVSDANNDTAYINATVGGNYQFPVLNINSAAYGVYCTGSLGLPPYKYAISSIGSNAGFGAYQPTDSFVLCPGTYWLRVQDSCGNIYTDSIDFRYPNPLSGNVICVNFAGGNLTVTASGGHPPYTFWAGGQSNHTGIFHGLHIFDISNAFVTDSCGSSYSYFYGQPQPIIYLTETCPFNGYYYYDPTNFYNAPFYGDTLTFTCTNCSPFQQHNFAGNNIDTVFKNIVPGTAYNFIITAPEGTCGVDTFPYQILPPAIGLTLTYNSCHSFTAFAGNNVPVDSYAVYTQQGILISSNHTGYFYNMPDSSYKVVAFISSACAQNPYQLLQIPHFDTACYVPVMDSSCSIKWLLTVNPSLHETYFLINSLTDTIAANPVDTFFGLMPDTAYRLVSDSGCQINITTPQSFVYVDAIASTSCSGTTKQLSFNIKAAGCYQYEAFLKLYHNNQLVYSGTIPVNLFRGSALTVTDTGYYTYRVFLQSVLTQPYVTYDTNCPVSAGQLYVSGSNIPYPFPNFGYVCYPNSTDSIHYHIYGGSPPYTVNVQGFGTTVINGNDAVFPTYAVGTYTMIVYDNCGISRSIAFNVIDTCTCNAFASIAANAPIYCAGDTVQLLSYTRPSSAFSWYVNGSLYSISPDTVFTPAASGIDSIKFVAVVFPGCADSAYTVVYIDSLPYTFLGNDTTYCGPFSATLQTPYASTVWSTGATGSTLTVTTPGVYGATVSNQCGSSTASISINQFTLPYLGNDTLYCGQFAITLATNIPATNWSTGAVGPSIVVSTPGMYYASFTNQCGTITDSIHIAQIPAGILTDTAYCDTFSRTLAINNATAIWSTGVTGPAISVSVPGIYTANVTDQCGIHADSFIITSNAINGLQIIAGDSSLIFCNHKKDSVMLLASIDSISATPVTFLWNTGQTNGQVFSSILMIDTAGIYQVTATRGQCMATVIDTIHCDTVCMPGIVIPDAFTPNGDNRNDEYMIPYTCIPYSFFITIFDRWGQTVYQSTNIDRGWDGTFKGTPQPQGIYLCFICIKEKETSKNVCRTGTLNLVR